jgi:hypothetical protein
MRRRLGKHRLDIYSAWRNWAFTVFIILGARLRAHKHNPYAMLLSW